MSFLTIHRSNSDHELRGRIVACVVQQAWNNENFGSSEYGKLVKATPDRATDMIWCVCVATDVEASYAYAMSVNHPNPGGDEAVITDGMILSNVQTKWPADTY